MTDGRTRAVQAGADLRWMRGVTAATLAALILIGGFLQIVLGLGSEPGPRTALLIAATVTSVILGLAVVPLLLRPSPGNVIRHPLVLALIASASLTWVLALTHPFAGWGWAFLLAIAGGMLSCLVRGWWQGVALAGTLLAIGLGGVSIPMGSSPAGSSEASSLVILVSLILVTFMPLSTIWVLRVVVRLDEARRTASELAIATERLRFATDLHDIQGHHLQVIALKGELAERRLLAGDDDLAASELSEIRRIAQAALEDTRAVVNDYRAVTVAVEARNAAAVLQSAGIHCTTRIDAPDLSTELGTVFAVAIREATTNILRHSNATRAALELVRPTRGEYRLTVANDGSGDRRTGGTGIAGLTSRVSAWNGTVQVNRRDDTFTLTVSIPVPSPSAYKEER